MRDTFLFKALLLAALWSVIFSQMRAPLMEAPRCRTCGQKHWQRICPVTPDVTRVTPPVTEPVTPSVTVTKPVTPVTKTIAVVCAQCQVYDGEIKRLKLALAAAHVSEPVPAAERTKATRLS